MFIIFITKVKNFFSSNQIKSYTVESRFLKPPDNSNQKSFPLDLFRSNFTLHTSNYRFLDPCLGGCKNRVLHPIYLIFALLEGLFLSNLNNLVDTSDMKIISFLIIEFDSHVRFSNE